MKYIPIEEVVRYFRKMDTYAQYVVALAWSQANGRVTEKYAKKEVEEKLGMLSKTLKKISRRKIKSKCRRCKHSRRKN